MSTANEYRVGDVITLIHGKTRFVVLKVHASAVTCRPHASDATAEPLTLPLDLVEKAEPPSASAFNNEKDKR